MALPHYLWMLEFMDRMGCTYSTGWILLETNCDALGRDGHYSQVKRMRSQGKLGLIK